MEVDYRELLSFVFLLEYLQALQLLSIRVVLRPCHWSLPSQHLLGLVLPGPVEVGRLVLLPGA